MGADREVMSGHGWRESSKLRFRRHVAPLALVVAGAMLALVLHRLWSLPTRFFVAFIVGTLLVCASTFFLGRFADFLLVMLMFLIPLAAFRKYFLLDSINVDESGIGILLYSGLVSIGLVDIVLLGLYGVWIIRIFVSRTAPVPHFRWLDTLVLLLVASYIFSIPGTPVPLQGLFAVYSLLRLVALYFYVSRNFERVHIPWLYLAVMAAIVVEGGLGAVQFATGKYVGLAMDRGAGVRMDEQYQVPGITHRNRATGSVSESHTFGLYVAMLAQFMLVLMLDANAAKVIRLLAALLFVAALVLVLISFSRSAWISCAVAVAIVWAIHLKWGERQILVPTLVAFVVLLALMPWITQLIVERFSTAEGLVQERFNQYPVAWRIWMEHFLCGYGVGNYMEALKVYNVSSAAELPVHNVFLWIAAETGLVGVIAFFSIAFAAIVSCWQAAVKHVEPTCRLAVAVLAGLVAYLLDGLTDPLYREPVVFTMFWFCIGIAGALPNLGWNTKRRNRDGAMQEAAVD